MNKFKLILTLSCLVSVMSLAASKETQSESQFVESTDCTLLESQVEINGCYSEQLNLVQVRLNSVFQSFLEESSLNSQDKMNLLKTYKEWQEQSLIECQKAINDTLEFSLNANQNILCLISKTKEQENQWQFLRLQ